MGPLEVILENLNIEFSFDPNTGKVCKVCIINEYSEEENNRTKALIANLDSLMDCSEEVEEETQNDDSNLNEALEYAESKHLENNRKDNDSSKKPFDSLSSVLPQQKQSSCALQAESSLPVEEETQNDDSNLNEALEYAESKHLENNRKDDDSSKKPFDSLSSVLPQQKQSSCALQAESLPVNGKTETGGPNLDDAFPIFHKNVSLSVDSEVVRQTDENEFEEWDGSTQSYSIVLYLIENSDNETKVQVCLEPKSGLTDWEPQKLKHLAECFPHIVVEEDLNHFLDLCGGDEEWLMNVLLDYVHNNPNAKLPSTCNYLSDLESDNTCLFLGFGLMKPYNTELKSGSSDDKLPKPLPETTSSRNPSPYEILNLDFDLGFALQLEFGSVAPDDKERKSISHSIQELKGKTVMPPQVKRDPSEPMPLFQVMGTELALKLHTDEKALKEKGKFAMAEEKAAKLVSQEKNPFKSPYVIDLHGLVVKEAISKLDHFLKYHKGGLEALPGTITITVITGQGNHSIDGRSKLQSAVMQFLNEANYDCRVATAGSIEVSLRVVGKGKQLYWLERMKFTNSLI